MTTINLYLRTSKAGVERALWKCRAIGTGAKALHDAATYLLTTGAATASDTLRVYRGRTFHRAVPIGVVAGAV